MPSRAIIVGAGHNGLVSACVLAGAGWDVTVFERRKIAGGACVTEELIPGFRISTAAYSFSLFRPEIAAALDLARHGLSVYPKEPRMFVPLPGGRAFFVWRDAARTANEIASISQHDADAYPRWNAFWEEVADHVRPMMLGEAPSMRDVEDSLGPEMFRLAIAGSASATVREFFDHENVQGAFAGQGIIGTARPPSEDGTAFVMTYHAFGGELVDGAGTWAYVRGGMGGVTAALRRCAEERGARILAGEPVARIITSKGRATGVLLADGSTMDADMILSNADPKTTFLRLLDASEIPGEFAERVLSLPTPGSVVKVNLALRELPDFLARPGTSPGPQHAGTVEISPSIESLDAAYEDAAEGRVSARPFMELFMQSVTDDSLAPPGKHVASCFAQYAPAAPENWDAMRADAGDKVIDMLASYAPNIRDAIIHREVLGPPDLEARFGLAGGNIFHGEIVPGRIFADRFGARTPVRGLYLCGSGAHPGGGVSGAPGWNAARAVLADGEQGTT